MRQSTVIFGTLLLAFVMYITLRGQLPAYFSIFTGADVANAPDASKEGNAAQSAFDKVFENFDKWLDTVGYK